MKEEIYQNLFCGSEQDYWKLYNPIQENGIEIQSISKGWAIVHACKEPFHRLFLNYAGRGAPKDSPEYYFAQRNNRLALNMVDAPRPEFFNKCMIDKGLEFIDNALVEGLKVLVHCNLGESRAPSICLLYLIKKGIISGSTFMDCESEFMKLYQGYNPGQGMREFCKVNYKEFI